MNALRSAKIWFDAAYKLVEMQPSIFRMDEEIENIVTSYEKKGEENPRFRDRWRKYTKDGYISGMKRQLGVIDYLFVGNIARVSPIFNPLSFLRKILSLHLQGLPAKLLNLALKT